MAYSYIFPNNESQWDEVGYGSSADDPYPSTLFSATKHNKAIPISCSIGIGEGGKLEISFTQSCNTVLLDISHLFHGSINCSKNLVGLMVDFTKGCLPNANSSINDFLAFVEVKKDIIYSALDITSTNCLVGKNIPDTFKKKSSLQESCVEYTSWHPPELQLTTSCNSKNINEPFDHGYISPPEFCISSNSILISTGFSGCRSENIGLQSLPNQFGTEYVIAITCKFLPQTTSSVLTSSCTSDIYSEYNSVNGGVQISDCNFLQSQQYSINRTCNLFINASAPLIQYGRINSMVMMPVFRDYGRISG